MPETGPATSPRPARGAGSSVLVLENVSREYLRGSETVRAVDGVSLVVVEGSLTAIVGPSGSGKSTLLHLMAGLDRPTRGRVLIDGKDLAGLGERELTLLRRRQVGFVFQFFNLLPNLLTWQNIALPLLLDGTAPRVAFERAAGVADLLGIRAQLEAKAGSLSGGEQQRAALARALIADPAFVLADEPTGNLDSRTGQDVLEVIRDVVRRQRRTVILVTHDQRAAAIADRVVRLHDGRVEADSAALASRALS